MWIKGFFTSTRHSFSFSFSSSSSSFSFLSPHKQKKNNNNNELPTAVFFFKVHTDQFCLCFFVWGVPTFFFFFFFRFFFILLLFLFSFLLFVLFLFSFLLFVSFLFFLYFLSDFKLNSPLCQLLLLLLPLTPLHISNSLHLPDTINLLPNPSPPFLDLNWNGETKSEASSLLSSSSLLSASFLICFFSLICFLIIDSLISTMKFPHRRSVKESFLWQEKKW